MEYDSAASVADEFEFIGTYYDLEKHSPIKLGTCLWKPVDPMGECNQVGFSL